jgi:hypothetical protein
LLRQGASVFSTSSTAPHLFADRQEDFEADLRKILAQASPAGRFSIRLSDNILRIWRLPTRAEEAAQALAAFSNEIGFVD